MDISIEKITPKIAAEMLSKNPSNRSISSRKVAKLATDMQNGDFIYSHQGIAIDEDGNLIDGQHRLSAIIKSGTTQTLQVTRNLPRKVMEVVDRSDKRTFGQELTMGGHKNANVIASTLRLYVAFKNDGESLTKLSIINVSEQELRNNFNQDFVTSATISTKYHYRFPMIPRGDYSLLYYLLIYFKKIDTETVNLFFEELTNGSGLDSKNPILIYRNFFINNSNRLGQKDQHIRIARLIKLWNAWAKGAKVDRFGKFEYDNESEQFPKVFVVNKKLL